MRRLATLVMTSLLIWSGSVVIDINRARATVKPVATWPVVGTGDSILAMAFGYNWPGGTKLDDEFWINTEHGRNAWTSGGYGPNGHSTVSVGLLAASRAEPGGWLIIQDNGLGTSDLTWRSAIRTIVRATPRRTSILAVLPGAQVRGQINATTVATIRRRATIMGEEVMRHPSRAFINLQNYITAHPGEFPDGQHPEGAARTWLYGQVMRWANWRP